MVYTTLSRNGYKIKKNELSQKELKDIKKDLTVNPYVVGDFGNGNEKRFSLYMESPNSLYIPRFYAFDKYGLPEGEDGPMTSATLLVVGKGHAVVAHVGMTRAILVRWDKITKLSRMHSVASRMIENGKLYLAGD